ncbi:MAG: hypothetical protein NVS3B5_02110 [Sphingomicrobium sp.]
MSRPPVEFCWQCHGYRVGMTLPHKCEDFHRCRRVMADTATIEPAPVPRKPFDFAELDEEQRLTLYVIMGVVASVLLLAFAFS